MQQKKIGRYEIKELLGAGLVGGVGGPLAELMIKEVPIVMKNSLESGEPSWLSRGAFGALVAAYAFRYKR